MGARIPEKTGRWVMQTHFFEHPNGGNCTEAAVASLLGITLDEVGDFPKGKNAEQALAMTEFFRARGFDLVKFYSKGSGHYYAFEGLYLAVGPTKRYEGLVKHMVVMRDGQLAHDPHPDGTGLTSIDCVYLAVPFDPGRLAEPRNSLGII